MGLCATVGKVVAVVVLLVAMLIGAMSASCSCRRSVFSSFIRLGSNPSAWSEKVVCPHVARVRGVVVDIGTGAGLSLHCYENNTAITKLIIVEPNPEFRADLEKKVAAIGMADKATILMEGGESLGTLPDASADFAVSLHLLCSVDAAVLQPLIANVGRVLKQGGQYLPIDHTTYPAGTAWRMAQEVVAPVWEIVGNGCKFLDMVPLYEQRFPAAGMSDVAITEFEYPILGRYMRLVDPHVRAVATKA